MSREWRGGQDIDARKALEKVVDMLMTNQNYYSWTPMGDPTVWLLRVPRTGENDARVRSEVAEVVHICSPHKLLEAFETQQKTMMAQYAAYVRDDSCSRCRTEIPENLRNKMFAHVKLWKLGKAIND